MMRAIILFAILASFLLLLGCAAQQQQAQQPEKTVAQPAPDAQAQPSAQAEPSELQKELDAQDAGVQESITDLDSFQ